MELGACVARDLLVVSNNRSGSAMAARAKDCPLLVSGVGKIAWQMQDRNTWCAAGNATLATAEKSRAALDSAGRQPAALLQKVNRLALDALDALDAGTA
jgi:creatinine amidohydrolase